MLEFTKLVFINHKSISITVQFFLLNMNIYRSVLVLNGNGADVAKHCVPAVPTKRFALICCIFSELIGLSHSKSDALLSKTQDIHYLQKNGPSKVSIQF